MILHFYDKALPHNGSSYMWDPSSTGLPLSLSAPENKNTKMAYYKLGSLFQCCEFHIILLKNTQNKSEVSSGFPNI